MIRPPGTFKEYSNCATDTQGLTTAVNRLKQEKCSGIFVSSVK